MAQDALNQAGLDVGLAGWIDAGAAVDLPFTGAQEGAQETARMALDALELPLDHVVHHRANRACRLFVADMDSTMITVECIDELADYAGLKDQIAAVTERAMRGELDFAEALAGRVALLAGLDAEMIARCRAERVRLTPGARTLVQTLKARGAHSLLVSGGFLSFAEPVAAEIGFDRAVANFLHISSGLLDGTVAQPIVDSARKRMELLDFAEKEAIPTAQIIAIGDGANDIPMIEVAGLGVAYHAKPRTREAANAAIDHGDLTTLLYALGIPRAQWVRD